MVPTNAPPEIRRCSRFQHPMRPTGHAWYCPSCLSPYPKPTKFERDIEHVTYKAYDIRCQPQKHKEEEKTWWRVHIDITFNGDGSEKHGERYLSQNDAHIAGFELGYRLIDERSA